MNRLLVLALLLFACAPCAALAQQDLSEEPDAPSLLDELDLEWGGHVKLRGAVGWPDDDSLYAPVGLQPLSDASAEARLKATVYLGDYAYVEAHYEALLSGGETRRRTRELEGLHPMFAGASEPLDDDRRLLDLTSVAAQNEAWVLSHRLDRAFLAFTPDWGSVTVGRQAVTWGNGMLYSPLDLMNPFAPTDVIRDYKVGDDMVHVQVHAEPAGSLELVCVPRRDPVEREARWSETSAAIKLHSMVDSLDLETDLMLAKHYDDAVAGLGLRGYLGDAAWRADATWTFLRHRDRDRSGFFSLTANLDYSWVWWDKNFYGFLEFSYLGLSDNDYEQSFTHSAISERVARGELHLLGQTYVSAHVDVELHPLLRAYLTTITNLADPSGSVQPRLVWSVSQDLDATLGANLCWGERGTEFGGFEVPGTDLSTRPVNSVYCLLSWYF